MFQRHETKWCPIFHRRSEHQFGLLLSRASVSVFGGKSKEVGRLFDFEANVQSRRLERVWITATTTARSRSERSA